MAKPYIKLCWRFIICAGLLFQSKCPFITKYFYGVLNRMTQDELKKQVAEAALKYVKDVPIIGVGTGSTVNHFIDFLADIRQDIEGAVSSSKMSTERLQKIGIRVFDLNETGDIEVQSQANVNGQPVTGVLFFKRWTDVSSSISFVDCRIAGNAVDRIRSRQGPCEGQLEGAAADADGVGLQIWR